MALPFTLVDTLGRREANPGERDGAQGADRMKGCWIIYIMLL